MSPDSAPDRIRVLLVGPVGWQLCGWLSPQCLACRYAPAAMWGANSLLWQPQTSGFHRSDDGPNNMAEKVTGKNRLQVSSPLWSHWQASTSPPPQLISKTRSASVWRGKVLNTPWYGHSTCNTVNFHWGQKTALYWVYVRIYPIQIKILGSDNIKAQSHFQMFSLPSLSSALLAPSNRVPRLSGLNLPLWNGTTLQKPSCLISSVQW